ncbi:MAG: hypothetical protein HYY22_07175 [Thaumarchaeota archaeon]|nr:hypothetical protein [Nitrososphaerota archaeon]
MDPRSPAIEAVASAGEWSLHPFRLRNPGVGGKCKCRIQIQRAKDGF